MELEFDKEIDAILRKARAGAGASLNAGHLDADTIAAFAENALPVSTRSLYVEHLADCGRCRKLLSESIVMNRGADATAASTVLAAAETGVPWYSKIFRTPSLAIAMGSLVLIFSGVLGFILLQRQGESAANNAIVSRATERQPAEAPYYSGESSSATNTNAAPATNSDVNPASQPSIAVPGTVTSGPNAPMNEPTGDAGKTAPAEEKSLDDNKAPSVDGTSSGLASAPKPQPPAAAAPPPVDQPKTESDKIATGEDETAKEKDLSRTETRDSRSRMDREAVPEALKKAGPMRGAGPLNSQQQANNSGFEMSVTRNVGGKTFTNRNGAWYDTAYRQQQTTNIRRGSDEFKKLDGGLRSIANELYGVVIVVWKGKAYRIN